MEINHKQLTKMIKTVYEKRLPLMVWGAVGIGKSQVVRDTAKELANQEGLEFSENGDTETFRLIDIRVSQLDPSDLRGLPTVSEDMTKWIPPNTLPRKGKGIIFLDEINLAPPSIQAAAYQLILDRRLGDYILPDGFVIVAAGNRIEDKANVFEMSSALSNRFLHVTLNTPSLEDWTEWALGHDIDARIVSFLQFKPTVLFNFNPQSKERAFSTPRTWEYTSKLIKNNEGELDMMAGSAVGEGIANEFMAFMKLSRKLNLDEILDKPQSVKEITEIDVLYCLLGGLSEKFRSNSKILEKLLEVTKYVKPEFAILLLRFAKGVNKSYFLGNVTKCKNWKDIYTSYGKYLT